MSSQPSESPYADALEKVTFEDLEHYPGKLVAVSLEGEGIIAAADTLEELAIAAQEARGENHPYAVACGP